MAQVRRYADDMGGALTTTGSLNAYVVNTGSGITELRPGIKLLIRANRTNTGEATFNADGLGPLPWVDAGGVRLTAGQIVSGRFYEIVLDADGPAWRVQAGASTLSEIPGLIALQADVAAKAAATAADRATVVQAAADTEADRAEVAQKALFVDQNYQVLAGAVTQITGFDGRLTAENTRALLGELQAYPKYLTTPRIYVEAHGGATAGAWGFTVPVGQDGVGSLARIYWDIDPNGPAPELGRPIVFLAELKTSIAFGTAFVGPGGAADTRLSITPEGMPDGTTATLLVTDRADTYVLLLATVLSAPQAQIAANIQVSGGAKAQTKTASVALTRTMWVPRDTAGATDVLRNAVAPLPSSVGELIGVTQTILLPGNGAQPGFAGRGFVLPIGQDCVGSRRIDGIPLQGLPVGTPIDVRFTLQTDPNTGLDPALNTRINVVAAVLTRNVVDDAVGPVPSIRQVGPNNYEGHVTWKKVDDTETKLSLYVDITGGSARTTPGFVVLRSVGLTINGATAPYTVASAIDRYMESIRALMAFKGVRRTIITAALDGTGDVSSVRVGVTAVGPGASASEMNEVQIRPGIYTGENSLTASIDPAENVAIIGLGGRGDVKIISKSPANQAYQEQLNPFLLRTSCLIRNLYVEVENQRYPFHIEGGNSTFRARQILEDVIAVHRGATGWGSWSPFGIGQHAGNHILLRRCEGHSPSGGIGFHNNVNWSEPASITMEYCRWYATGDSGQAVSIVSMGAGLTSSVTMLGCDLLGYLKHDAGQFLKTLLRNHRANRYEYTLNAVGCSPFDWLSICSVDALTLTSAAGASSSVAVSGPLFDVLFGPSPDMREGAADYAARVYSEWAMTIGASDEDGYDPGVTPGARLGNRSSSPISGTVAFDGGSPVTLTLNGNYLGFDNATMLAVLNNALSAAMGGNTGGRAFSYAQPYVNRAPIYQLDRESIALNGGTATILKGHALAWSDGRSVRLMTASDTRDVFAGFAMGDAIPGRSIRFMRTGWLAHPHLQFAGTPTWAIGDRYGVGATPGVLALNAGVALVRVRSIQGYGTSLEILDGRNSTSVASATGSASDVSVNDAWADYVTKDFVATSPNVFATAISVYYHQNASVAQMLARMRLIDVATGTQVKAGAARGIVVYNDRGMPNTVMLQASGLTIGKTYRVALQHYRVGSNAPTVISDMEIDLLNS